MRVWWLVIIEGWGDFIWEFRSIVCSWVGIILAIWFRGYMLFVRGVCGRVGVEGREIRSCFLISLGRFFLLIILFVIEGMFVELIFIILLENCMGKFSCFDILELVDLIIFILLDRIVKLVLFIAVVDICFGNWIIGREICFFIKFFIGFFLFLVLWNIWSILDLFMELCVFM